MSVSRRMEGEPPAYPRVPHLAPGRGASRDDRVLSASESKSFLEREVVVEEKLDGASVALWLDGEGAVRVSTRGGMSALDRAGQRGPLRAWAMERSDALRALLDSGWVLYGEWLWLAHGVSYVQLPDWLVALDLWDPSLGFASLEERNRRLGAAGLARPPQLAHEILGSRARLDALMVGSAFGDKPAEGVVVRSLDTSGDRLRIAKALAPGYARRSDEEWRRPARNILAAGALPPSLSQLSKSFPTAPAVRTSARPGPPHVGPPPAPRCSTPSAARCA